MKKISRREVISRRQYGRSIFLIFVGIIILFTMFFFYGIPFLINFSLFVENFSGGDDGYVAVNDSSYVAPPIINPLPSATNSAWTTISGSALPKQTVKLYVNNKYINHATVANDRSFVFKNVRLGLGENTIKAITVDFYKKESIYSQTIHIVYKNKAPQLQITSPNDKQIISEGVNQIKVEGKTDFGSRVTINDYWAIVDNIGNFSYLLNLQKGENKIRVTAIDEAGNESKIELSIILNQ